MPSAATARIGLNLKPRSGYEVAAHSKVNRRGGRSSPARKKEVAAPGAASLRKAAATRLKDPGRGIGIRGRRQRAEPEFFKAGKLKEPGSFSFTLRQHIRATLLFLVAVLTKTFFPLVGRHLVALMLLSVGHSAKNLEVSDFS